MQENCEHCEEQLYWNNFKSLRFYQVLLPGFRNHLDLPSEFSIHLKKKLPQKVTLISPKGTKYIVRIEEDGENKLSFKSSGWEDFTKDHSLEVNDLLVFKFNRGGEFKVIVFNSQTYCEKPSSYFGKECGHAEKKIKVSQKQGHVIASDPCSKALVIYQHSGGQNNEGNNSLSARKKLQREPSYASVDNLNAEKKIKVSHNDEEDDIKSASKTLLICPSSSGHGNNSLSAVQQLRADPSNDLNADVEMISAGSETRRDLSLVKEAVSKDGFSVTMKKSHVVTRSVCINIPSEWCTKNKLLTNQDVIMQVGVTKWAMNLNVSGSRYRICGGWKKFVKDNILKENDVCVFEPANSETKPFHILVSISRGEEAKSIKNG